MDLVSVSVVELRLFLYANQKSPGVSAGIDIDMIFRGGSRNRLGFGVRGRP